MADAGFFKGTSADQDRRFSDKELKLLKTMKFPKEFDQKVDMRRVNLNVIRPWIAKKVVELVGFEDEVVIEYAMGLLEDKSQPSPDPRKMQINLMGFLTKDTPNFVLQLWKLLLEAQEEVTGVPRTFVEEKKEEMRKARENDSRAIGESDRRTRFDENKDGERDDRGGRGIGPERGRGRGRGGRGRGRGGYDDERGGGRPRDGGWGGRGGGPRRRDSRSPQRRRSRSGSRGPRGEPRRFRSPPRRRSTSRDIHSSRSPPPPPAEGRRRPARRSPSISRSPPPPQRRRLRSPSYSPPRDGRRRRTKSSGSPTTRRRRLSRSATPPSSRSRTPPRGYDRRRSMSGDRRRSMSPQRQRRKTPGSKSPRRNSPPSGRFSTGKRTKRSSRSRSTDTRSSSSQPAGDKMHVDEPQTKPSNELKIKGQAELERRKSKWDDLPAEHASSSSKIDLEKRENELKEKALRNKVIRTRKGSSG